MTNNNNKWEEFHANNKSLKVYKQYEKNWKRSTEIVLLFYSFFVISFLYLFLFMLRNDCEVALYMCVRVCVCVSISVYIFFSSFVDIVAVQDSFISDTWAQQLWRRRGGKTVFPFRFAPVKQLFNVVCGSYSRITVCVCIAFTVCVISPPLTFHTCFKSKWPTNSSKTRESRLSRLPFVNVGQFAFP